MFLYLISGNYIKHFIANNVQSLIRWLKSYLEPVCIPRDSDECIKRAYYWGRSYSCDYFKKYPYYCTKYEKDGRRCCPEMCDNLETFTKERCEKSSNYGTCDYSQQLYNEGAQCSTGRTNIALATFYYSLEILYIV